MDDAIRRWTEASFEARTLVLETGEIWDLVGRRYYTGPDDREGLPLDDPRVPQLILPDAKRRAAE